VSLKITTAAEMCHAVGEHVMGWGPFDQSAIQQHCGKTHDGFLKWRNAKDFVTDPAASFALEEKMRELGWDCQMATGHQYHGDDWWYVAFLKGGAQSFQRGSEEHRIRFVGMCVAALAALGVQVEYGEEWWTK